MYTEAPSALPGAVVWTNVFEPGEVRILPDGCMDLMWDGERVVVAGPDTRAQVFTAAGGEAMIGVRLRPGMGPRVVALPAGELRDQRVPLAQLWPTAEVRRLEERLAVARDPGAVLSRAAGSAVGARRGDPLVTELVCRVRRGEPVGAVAAAVGLSPRQLQRRSVEAFGYGLKTLARILRLGRALDLARSGVGLAAAAALAGYADQAHLSRDVRALAGVPLGQLLGSAANRSTELPSGSWTTA